MGDITLWKTLSPEPLSRDQNRVQNLSKCILPIISGMLLKSNKVEMIGNHFTENRTGAQRS